MRAQYNEFVSLNATRERNLDIGAGDASHLIVLTRHHTATPGPLLRDIVGCRLQGVRPEHVAFADVSGKNFHMALQRRSQVGDVRSQHAIRSRDRPCTVINTLAGSLPTHRASPFLLRGEPGWRKKKHPRPQRHEPDKSGRNGNIMHFGNGASHGRDIAAVLNAIHAGYKLTDKSKASHDPFFRVLRQRISPRRSPREFRRRTDSSALV